MTLANSRLAVLGLGALAVGGTLAVAVPTPSYGRSEAIAAVFPPWWPAERAFSAAAEAGPLLNTGRSALVLIVAFTDPEVAERLRSAGAILLLDAAALGCASSTEIQG